MCRNEDLVKDLIRVGAFNYYALCFTSLLHFNYTIISLEILGHLAFTLSLCRTSLSLSLYRRSGYNIVITLRFIICYIRRTVDSCNDNLQGIPSPLIISTSPSSLSRNRMASYPVLLLSIVVILSAFDRAFAACSSGCNTTIQSVSGSTFFCCNGESGILFITTPQCGFFGGSGPFSDDACTNKGFTTFASPPPSACPESEFHELSPSWHACMAWHGLHTVQW